jgi:hypothetical protein
MTAFPESVEPYRDKDWVPLPLPEKAKKSPPVGHTGETGRDPDLGDYARWKGEYPHGNTALRLAEGFLGIDIDNYGSKKGALNLEEFAVKHGLPALPPTISTTSRGPGHSGIYIYRYNPALMEGRKFLPEICANVELIHHGYRYALAWPSIHPDTGAMYRWRTTGTEIMPEALIPPAGTATGVPLKWLMAVSFKVAGESASGGGRASTRTATTLLPKHKVEAWLADQHGDGMPWKGLYHSVTDRIIGKALEATRYAAMRWATSMVVGDVMARKIPGLAVWDLEAECRALYEMPPPGKAPKSWRPTKERDFWNLVAGAMAHYDEGGPWRDRIEDSIEAGRVSDWIAKHGIDMDSVEVDPVEEDSAALEPNPAPAPAPATIPIEPVEEDDDWIMPTPSMGDDGAGLVLDSVGAGVVAAADSMARIAAMDPEERAAFMEIVREEIERTHESNDRAKVAGSELVKHDLRPEVAPRRFTRDDFEEWWRQAKARVRSRKSLTNEFEAVIRPHWIEDDWLPKSSLVTVVSPPSVGKTIFLVDMACRLALGVEWHGAYTEQTTVLYLAFESPDSVNDRILAWSQENRALLESCTDPDLVTWRGDVPTPRKLCLVRMAGVDLTSEGGMGEITNQMVRAAKKTSQIPGVVIIDTLAQAMGGGEENDAGVMGTFVINMRGLLNNEGHEDTTILAAHHPTKNTPVEEHGTSRGSGALLAAMDVEVSLRRIVDDYKNDTGIIEARRQKARDGMYGVIVKGKKTVVGLVKPDGTPLIHPRTGVHKSNVVWVPATGADMLDATAEALSKDAETKAILKVELTRHADLLLDEMGWVAGIGMEPPKSGFSRRALLDRWSTPGKKNGSAANEVADEVVAEMKRKMAEDYAAQQAEADGVD